MGVAAGEAKLSSFDLKKKVVELLSSNPGKQFKAREIALWIAKTYPDAAAAKMERSGRFESPAQLLNQIVAEIGANRPLWERQYPQLRTTGGVRPRLYYWSERSEEQEIADAERPQAAAAGDDESVVEAGSQMPETTTTRLAESDLYPVLVGFLESEYPAKGFRIDEKRSSNTYGAGANKWLFPDVVALEDLTQDMQEEVVTAIRESRDRQLRLWSFEVKLLINRSNARETYFQAVSNSSWANFGYLVTSAIEGVDTLKELRILYAVHGIGLIRLDTENPAESEILVPAREKSDVEWPMCSRLAIENKDFRAFMKKVRQFYQTGDI